MVRSCSLIGCDGKGCTLRSFPQNVTERSVWIERCGENLRQTRTLFLCDRHFSIHCRAPGTKHLKHGSLPSLFMPTIHDESLAVSNIQFSNKKRKYPARRINMIDYLEKEMPANDLEFSDDQQFSEPEPECSTQSQNRQDIQIISSGISDFVLPENTPRKMGGCCAFGCSNSAEKGFLMKRFPADPVRRALWASNVNRKNWTPTNSSYLCEAHFTPDMFENNRADGRRLLKWSAVPTIFSHIPATEAGIPVKQSSTRKIPSSPKSDESSRTASPSCNDEEPITNEIPTRLFKKITLEKLNSDPSTCFNEVLSNHGLMQQNEDFKFCLFLFHEMQFLSSNDIKNNVRKSIQQVLLEAFEHDGQET